MGLQLVQVIVKAHDDAALGRFWADALGWGVSSEGPGVTNVEPVNFVWPDPAAVCIDVVAGQGDVPWLVLADPEGNAFCLLSPRS
ncbi:hypothetical protein ACQP2E_16775 [Actinoplanes sp. CA-015351]|uniref:hypothetical protein n=1 Tax=Actinoplanes sp. CA-015351 TaxID=3239897 RepID=UPI003D95EA09